MLRSAHPGCLLLFCLSILSCCICVFVLICRTSSVTWCCSESDAFKGTTFWHHSVSDTLYSRQVLRLFHVLWIRKRPVWLPNEYNHVFTFVWIIILIIKCISGSDDSRYCMKLYPCIYSNIVYSHLQEWKSIKMISFLYFNAFELCILTDLDFNSV